MAITQNVQTGVARSLEISTDNVTYTQIARLGGRELTSYQVGRTRPTNQADSGSAALSNKKVGTHEITLTWESVYTDDVVDLFEPLIETTLLYVRVSDRDKESNVPYTQYRGPAILTETYDATGEQSVAFAVMVDALPVAGTFT